MCEPPYPSAASSSPGRRSSRSSKTSTTPQASRRAHRPVLQGALPTTPFGLRKDEVYITYVIPKVLEEGGRVRGPTHEEIARARPGLLKELEYIWPLIVVALGHIAKEALGPRAHYLPHPSAILLLGDRGELPRKIRRLGSVVQKEEGQWTTPEGSEGSQNSAEGDGSGKTGSSENASDTAPACCASDKEKSEITCRPACFPYSAL